MKNWIQKIRNHRYFLLFILLFAYLQSIYLRILVRQEINAYTFTPEAALFWLVKAGVLFVVILALLKKWQQSGAIRTQQLLKVFGVSLLVFLVIMKLLGFIVASIFDTVERNFNWNTFHTTLVSDLLDGIIGGSFFLAYFYYHKDKHHQQQLANSNQALSESRINQLKLQLNPHFLFNNLNVLDQLIEEDKDKASAFLNEFAEIYRYVLQASDKNLIPLEEELAFAQKYFRLIAYKYGDAYQLIVESHHATGYIAPLTLQLLIENAVQHNLGTVTNPIRIQIEAGESVVVRNNCNPKRAIKPTHGRALNNLKEQYKLLSDKPIEVRQPGDTFVVRIPFVETVEK